MKNRKYKCINTLWNGLMNIGDIVTIKEVKLLANGTKKLILDEDNEYTWWVEPIEFIENFQEIPEELERRIGALDELEENWGLTRDTAIDMELETFIEWNELIEKAGDSEFVVITQEMIDEWTTEWKDHNKND